MPHLRAGANWAGPVYRGALHYVTPLTELSHATGSAADETTPYVRYSDTQIEGVRDIAGKHAPLDRAAHAFVSSSALTSA